MIRFVFHLAGALVLTSASLVSAAQSRGSFDWTLDVSGAVKLEVWSGSGSIAVRTGGDGTVEIHGTIRARDSRADAVRHYEANPPIEQDGNIITVGRIDDRDLRQHLSISYELVVPVDTNLVSETGSGSLVIDDISGPLEVASGSGSVEIGRIGSNVDVRSGSGSIDIAGVAGDLIVETGSGDIRAEGVVGAISAESGSGAVRLAKTGQGDVDVEKGSGPIGITGAHGRVRAHTSSGSIDVEGEITGEWDLDTSSGRITVELRGESGFDLDAETNSGRIDLEDPVTTSGTLSNERLRGSVRGGGPRLGVRTSSGSIRIR